MKKIILIAFCSLVFTATFAQRKEARQQKKEERKERINQLIKQEEEGALIFSKQSVFGIKLTTDGYGAFFELGRLKTPTKTNLYSIEIGEHKHSKEEKTSVSNLQGFTVGNPYIYGKINNFYNVKLGFGQQRLIGGKGNKNGVAVSALYGGGFSAALLKPYYLDVIDPQTNERKDVKYDNNDAVFLDPSYIVGSSGIFKGFNQLKFVPGGFLKTGLRFDYGRYNEMVNAIEVGLNIEYYSKPIQIMLLNDTKQLFFNAYVSIVFGKRK